MEENRKHPVVVEQFLNFPPTVVWNAITDPTEMRQWFFDNIPDFNPTVGFETTFPVSSGDILFVHKWKILEVETAKKIKFHWSYEGIEGEGFVTFDLLPQGDKTLLRLTNKGLDSFPENVPEFSRASCRAGWEYFINQRLNAYLKDAYR